MFESCDGFFLVALRFYSVDMLARFFHARADVCLYVCGWIAVPSISATFRRNALRSCSTLFLPFSMKSSKRAVKCAMRSRRSLKLKSMLGRVSAMLGAVEEYGTPPPESEEAKRLGVIVVAAIFDGVDGNCACVCDTRECWK